MPVGKGSGYAAPQGRRASFPRSYDKIAYAGWEKVLK